jgi:hypothetical protein
MTREEKKQKKLEENEAKRLAKIEKKNNRFYKKLKAKINQLFESTKLTFCGKMFMLSIYTSIMSGIGICIVSVIKSIFDTFLAIVKVSTARLDLFNGASGVCWTLFVISLLCVIGLAIVEVLSLCDSEMSILEKEDEE